MIRVEDILVVKETLKNIEAMSPGDLPRHARQDVVAALQLLKKFDGYELLHAEERIGEQFFGLEIFVKMSERKVDREDGYGDGGKAIDDLITAIGTRTAQLDPKGAEMRELYRSEIANAYEKAGVTAIYMEPLPNGYCSRPCCLNKPWFRVTSSIGHVVVGRRKRVWSIDWKGSTVKQSGEELFPTEDVTKGETYVHAWTPGALTAYIRKLHVVRP